MKTVGRMVRRYILAAFAVVLLVFTVNAALLVGIVIHYGSSSLRDGFFPVGKFADSFIQAENGCAPDPSLAWQQHFAWAMLLSDGGEILWSENLPKELNHPYTVPEVAAFSRWYLQDYPVMVYRNDYGLLVAGKPKGSMTRFDFYMDNDILYALLSTFGPLLLLDLGLAGGQTSAGTGGGHRAFGRREGSPSEGIRRYGRICRKAESDQPPSAKAKRTDCPPGHDPVQLDCRGFPRYPHPAGTDYGLRGTACPAVPAPIGAAKKGRCYLHPEQKNKGPH